MKSCPQQPAIAQQMHRRMRTRIELKKIVGLSVKISFR
jgi:hypothetical protein